MVQDILENIGQFSAADVSLFKKLTTRKTFNKNDILLNEGEICQSVFFILSGCFFQFQSRTYLFDNSLNPAQKYNYIKEAKPLLLQMFPIKMIASYLKIAPETLSRVRANY